MIPRRLEVWIPGIPLGINAFRKLNTRARMSRIAMERMKAKMCALKAVRERYPTGQDTWTGPTIIDAEMRTSRTFKDSYVVGGSLKHYQDGLCDAVLPLGDGHKTPYRWNPPSQTRVAKRADEGVLFTVQEV